MNKQPVIASRINTFPEYVFSQLAKAVVEVELKTQRKVLNFGPGSPDIRPSPLYIDKLIEFIRDTRSHMYPGYGAMPELKDALTDWYQKRFGVVLYTDELLPLLGAKDGVSHLPLALADAGDEVLVPDPGYPAYIGPTLMVGAKPVSYDLPQENDITALLESLKTKLTNKTKYMWVNFPSNPTGQVATLDELKLIVEFALKHHLIVIYDNAYSEITFDGFVAPSILQIPHAKEIAVELGSFSKTFSLAGFRMGWIVGNKTIIEALAKVKSQLDSGLSLPLQRLGAHVLSHPDKDWQDGMLSNYQTRRDLIARKLKRLGLTFSLPKGALYIWAKIPNSYKNSEEFCMKLLQEKQVLLTPGSAFGSNGERFVRVSICVNIDKIEEYL